MPAALKHGLTLSGGGFRATLFHLGVIKLLRETGMLQSVHRIGAVSGGSILAAHLVLHWDRYTGDDEAFGAAAKEIIDFCRCDVRGNVTRGWLLAWMLIVPRVLKRRHWTFTNLLQKYYSKLFKDATLGNLHPSAGVDRPQVFFYCTSLSTGSSCAFGRSGFMWHDAQGLERNVVAPEIPLAYAIAASSAFPPLFPPIAITNNELFCEIEEFDHPHYLTDGGVYDNIGINRLMWYQQQVNDLDGFIVSDAEGDFDWEFNNDYHAITSRNIRASDVLMKRVSTLQYEMLARDSVELILIDIGKPLMKPDDPSVLSPAAQRCVRNIRTDLDAFSEVEISCLLQHGYAAAREALIKENLIPADTPGYSVKPPWPIVSSGKALPQVLRHSRYRKLGLWSAKDGKSWATLLLLCLFLCIPAVPWYLRLHTVEQQATAEAEVSRILTQTYVTQLSKTTPDPEAIRKTFESTVSPATAAAIPRIYVQIASASQLDRVKAITQPLQAKGYLVPGIETVGARAPMQSELRYFRDADQPTAESIARTLADEHGLTAQVIKFPGSKNTRAQHFELWCGRNW